MMAAKEGFDLLDIKGIDRKVQHLFSIHFDLRALGTGNHSFSFIQTSLPDLSNFTCNPLHKFFIHNDLF